MAPTKADITRLRVAQAARVPVTAEQVAAQLEPDDDAHSWKPEPVGDVLREWCDAGLLEELPGERFVHAQVFRDDTERRLVANLTVPRNVAALQHELRGDSQVGQLGVEAIEATLAGAERRGLVVRVGSGEPAEVVKAAAEHAETVAIPREKASAYVERLSHPTRAWRADGEHWHMTEKAFEALRVT